MLIPVRCTIRQLLRSFGFLMTDLGLRNHVVRGSRFSASLLGMYGGHSFHFLWYTFCVISFIVVSLYYKRICFTWMIRSYSEHTSRKNCFATVKKCWRKGNSIYSLNDVFLSRWLEEKYR